MGKEFARWHWARRWSKWHRPKGVEYAPGEWAMFTLCGKEVPDSTRIEYADEATPLCRRCAA